MRTNVTFRHPAEFVPLSDAGRVLDHILDVKGAQWFAAVLRRVPGLQIDENLCQEDWGAVLFARRNQKKFWIGLSAWEEEGAWFAHFHHGSFAWLQRFSSSGKNELKRLLADVHGILTSDPAFTDIVWYAEGEMIRPDPAGFPGPVED